ncbi:esterase [Mycobacterium sp. IS-836]|uniref:esterase n=1 Tax=Mycobacterium sp. IS-836 TaxID=1834160 RepID=UPI001301553F|nr:esterase [Mycobacterium sp. IS-836]
MKTMLRRIAIAIAATASIAGAPGCGTSSVTRQAASTTVATSLAAQGQSACAELNGDVGPDNICRVRSTTSTYKIEMTFPLDYPEMPAVAAFLKRDRDEFIDWVARFGPRDGRHRPYQYFVRAKAYRSGKPDARTQSLVLEIDNDTGAANEGHPDTTFRAFNFDLVKHVPITFDTLFKPGTKPMDVLNPIVRAELDAPSADLDETTYRNFAITDETVIFFFGQNQVVMDHAGPHKVAVPRIELASMLS